MNIFTLFVGAIIGWCLGIWYAYWCEARANELTNHQLRVEKVDAGD